MVVMVMKVAVVVRGTNGEGRGSGGSYSRTIIIIINFIPFCFFPPNFCLVVLPLLEPSLQFD